jgi:hypothetical protein
MDLDCGVAPAASSAPGVAPPARNEAGEAAATSVAREVVKKARLEGLVDSDDSDGAADAPRAACEASGGCAAADGDAAGADAAGVDEFASSDAWACGANASGALGTGDALPALRPKRVRARRRWAQLALGDSHAAGASLARGSSTRSCRPSRFRCG